MTPLSTPIRHALWLLLAAAAGYQAGARRDHRHELLEADRAFDRATAERGVSGWTSYFAADGKMVRGNGEIVTGPPAIEKLMQPLFAEPATSLRWAPDFAESSKSGDLGYTIGSSKLRSRDAAGKATERDGRYVTIWRKVAGQWKVALDIGTSGPVRAVE